MPKDHFAALVAAWLNGMQSGDVITYRDVVRFAMDAWDMEAAA